MEKRYVKHLEDKVLIKRRSEIVVRMNGMQYINPREDILLADGWEVLIEPVVSDEQDARQEAENAAADARVSLSDSDYKVIKCMEAHLCGETLPYDIVSLHIERDKQRRIINDYEEE